MAQTATSAPPQSRMDIERALALHREGRLDEAEQIYTAILEAHPHHIDALHLLGLLRYRQGRYAEALRFIGAVLKSAPRSADALNDHGLVLTALKRHEEALERFDEALAVRSDHVKALANRAGALNRLGRREDALAAYEGVLARKPDHIEARNEYAGVLADLGRLDEAIASYDRALAIAPELTELHINKGYALSALNRYEEALACFTAAAAIEPERAEAHFGGSLIRLRWGDFAVGWKGYEWRWRKADWAARRREFAAPLWFGQDSIESRTILLHAEQGYGDALQFVRYAPLVARRGANVVLECAPDLLRLLQSVEGVAQVVARDSPLPAFDFHCPLMSLPLAFDTRIQTVPNAVPYLDPPAEALTKWMNRLSQIPAPRIGLAWAGSPEHQNNSNRSIPLRDLRPLFSTPGANFISLQKFAAAEEVALLAEFQNVIHVGDALGDFADTAAIVASLDLVISVDSAIAHLAGALALPVWILLPYSPDFRWLLEREDSPWYPTARLFRQTQRGNWPSVIERVRQDLASRFLQE